MADHTFSKSRIPLLPDAELLRLFEETGAKPPRSQGPPRTRNDQVAWARRVEALRRELKARGLNNPPWWSVKRDWEMEDLPISAGAAAFRIGAGACARLPEPAAGA